LGRFIAWSVDHGLRLGGLVASPILGAEGNKEFLLLLRKPYGECNDKEDMLG
jgi:predicted rRNA methylase YqxC with S4 and FtsJ domains